MKCSYCNNEAEWVSNSVVYGRPYGKSHMIWLCRPCDAYAKCKNDTKQAEGTFANRELRQWRRKVHAMIDPLWQSKEYSRGMVYARLSDYFGFQFHVSQSTVETCKEAISILPKLFTF